MKKLYLCLCIIAALLLGGCVKTDTTLNIAPSGSGEITAVYKIDKSKVANDEAMNQVVTLITEQLEEQGITYSVGDDTDYKPITVNVPIEKITDIASNAELQKLALIPSMGTDGISVSEANGKVTFEGTMDAATMKTEQYSTQQGFNEGFEATFTIALPESALEANTEEKVDAGKHLYTWSATTSKNTEVKLVYAMGAQSTQSSESEPLDNRGGLPKNIWLLAAAVAAAVLIVAAVVLVILRRKNKEQ